MNAESRNGAGRTGNAAGFAAGRFDRILIVRLGAMGDVIHTLPAAVALRHAFPYATLGWLIEERWSELLCAPRYPRSGPRSPERPLVDRVHCVNTTEWRHDPLSFNTWQQIGAGLSQLRGVQYDTAIDFQGAVRSALLARWSGVQTAFGDAQPRENAASMFYTRTILRDGLHVIEQALSLAQALTGKQSGELKVEFPVDPDAEKNVDALTAGRKDFAILNPGAGWGAKMWPPQRYAEVARELALDGLFSLVNSGPGEQELANAVEAASAGSAKKIICSISDLISLTRRARLFIGGDTGPMHLAAAFKVPVVGIFGPTNPVRNGPFGTRSVVLRSSISTTDHSRKREPEQGMLEIAADEVVAGARKLLRESGFSATTNAGTATASQTHSNATTHGGPW